jgi:hypothetical protein
VWGWASARRVLDVVNDEINLWRTLTYHDPATILRRLRTLEHELADVDMEERVRRLRTPGLKTYREARDAALFVVGMGLGKGVRMLYTPFERSDYDFVATWNEGNTQHFSPVQLKELVPADLNPTASLEGLLTALKDERAKTSTVLAIKLNRRGRIQIEGLQMPKLPYSQLWLFWASSPDGNNWYLFGDMLTSPGYFAYEYPTQ